MVSNEIYDLGVSCEVFLSDSIVVVKLQFGQAFIFYFLNMQVGEAPVNQQNNSNKCYLNNKLVSRFFVWENHIKVFIKTVLPQSKVILCCMKCIAVKIPVLTKCAWWQ